MTTPKTTRYDVAEHLRSRVEVEAYLDACIEEADGDAAFIAKALGDIARAATRQGPKGAAAVPLKRLALLEELLERAEDAEDLEGIFADEDTGTIPWESLKAEISE